MPAIGFDRQMGRGGRRGAPSISGTIGKDFFDSDAVLAMMDKKTASGLSRLGYFVMRDARQSIRKRKSTSKPGSAPSNWTDLLRHIYFYFDRLRRSVIIGPVRLHGAKSSGESVPEALEEGGIVYPRFGKRGVQIRPRPYMAPAFHRQIQKQARKLIDAGIFLGGLDR